MAICFLKTEKKIMLKIQKVNQGWQHFVILALERLRQEDFSKVKTSLDSIVRSCTSLNKPLQ